MIKHNNSILPLAAASLRLRRKGRARSYCLAERRPCIARHSHGRRSDCASTLPEPPPSSGVEPSDARDGTPPKPSDHTDAGQ